MKLNLDTTVEVELKNNRTVKLDLGELQDFQETFRKEKGKEEPVLDAQGKPVLGPDQQPLTGRTVYYSDIEPELIAFVKQHGGVDIDRWEARALWDAIPAAWEKKRRSWRTPDEPKPPSAPSTTPAVWD